MSKLINNLKKLNFYSFFSRYGAASLLIALVLANIIITRNFLDINVVWNLITQGSVTIIVALGMSLAISSGGIDLSVGSVMPIAAMITAKLLGIGVLPAILIGLISAIAFGFINGLFVGGLGIQAFLVTLTTYMSGRGIAQLLNNSMVYNFVNENFTQISRLRIMGHMPVQLLILPLLVLLVTIIVKHTSIGRYVQAVGDNPIASRISGISIFRTMLFTYGMSALLAGLAGVLEVARIGAVDPNTLGKSVELDAIAAVVLGGTSMSGGRINMTGTIFAALVMQLIVITINMNNISAQYSYIVKSVILVAAVILQQHESTKN